VVIACSRGAIVRIMSGASMAHAGVSHIANRSWVDCPHHVGDVDGPHAGVSHIASGPVSTCPAVSTMPILARGPDFDPDVPAEHLDKVQDYFVTLSHRSRPAWILRGGHVCKVRTSEEARDGVGHQPNRPCALGVSSRRAPQVYGKGPVVDVGRTATAFPAS
jgi:hypothetical protein